MSKTYDADFYTWAVTQADAARRRSANEVDWDNVAEELEGLGRSELREIESRYAVLLLHLLKWLFQPERRGRSWSNTIAVQREKLAERLEESPGARPQEPAIFLKAYRQARYEASSETDLDLDTFPEMPPFTLEEAKDEKWLPD